MNWRQLKFMAISFVVFALGMHAIVVMCGLWEILGRYLGAEECLWDAVLTALLNLARLVCGMPLWRAITLCTVLALMAWLAYLAKYEKAHKALHATYLFVAVLWMVVDIFNKHVRKRLTGVKDAALTAVNAAAFNRQTKEALS